MPPPLLPSRASKILPRPPNYAPAGHGERSKSESRTKEDVEYLFINKSQTSKTLSNCKADNEQTVINSHAQRFKGKPSNQGQNTQLRVFREATNGPIRHDFQICTLSDWKESMDKERTEQVKTIDGSAFKRHGSLLSRSHRRRTALISNEPPEPVLYSNNFCEGDQCDPFSTSITPIDKSTHGILQFFLNQSWKAHLKNIGKADEAVWSQSFHNLSDIVKGCLSREVHMYALLTCNVMRMKCFGLNPVGRLASPEHLMSKTLRALRLHFSNASGTFPSDEQVILDIFFLAFSEFYRQDYAAMNTHLYMIRSVIGLFGGFEKISPYTREACWYTEICFSTETGESCMLELTWDPGPIATSRWVCVQKALRSGKIKPLGRGFQGPLLDQFFDIESSKIVEELMDDILAFEYIRGDDEALPSDSWWACTRTRAVVHRLLALTRIEEDNKPSIQELRVQCVATTLILYLCYENSYVTPLRSLPFILARLKRSLQLSNSDFNQTSTFGWNGHSEMLLWVLITGFWLSGVRPSADASWFLDRATHGCKTLALGSFEELRSLMGKFLWLEHLQTSSLTTLAGHVLTARGEM